MGVRIAQREPHSLYMSDSEQPQIFNGDMLISKAASWQDTLGQEQPFTRPDFRGAQKKVSPKVKK